LKDGLPSELNYQAQTACLRHLVPFTYTYTGHGHGGADLRVRITFTSHVFSERTEAGQHHDFLDENDIRRTFDPGRYAFSQSLPNHMIGILDHNTYSWRMQDKNGIVNLAVLAPPQPQPVSGNYETVFYYLYPSDVDGIDVEMRVKSCYAMDINFDKHRRRDKIRACVKKSLFENTRVPK
jgi:hypothetical protein